MVSRFQDDPDSLYEAGIEYAVNQLRDLIEGCLLYTSASGYRVTLFAGKVALMSVLCAGVPVIFSNVTLNDANPWQIIKMLFARGQTNF